MKYRPEIDGLRAFAVIPVILFHAGVGSFSGGFVGVDIFFVISGYLITTIILSEKEKGTFSLVDFYERRARRILPALFFVTFVSLLCAWFLFLPSDMDRFSRSLVAVSLFSSNILFWKEAGYFGGANELKPLLHTWSLAVEEQFYIFFPLFLMLMWRFRKRWIFSSLVLVAVVSLIGSQWAAYSEPTANFLLLPTRVWELALGAFVAFYFLYCKQLNRVLLSHQFVAETLSFVGMLMIGYAIYSFDKTVPFPSFYALVPTVGTCLIILFSSSQGFVGRLLGAKLFVGIGLISYSAYLWHQPILAFARYSGVAEQNELFLVGIASLSFPLAYFTWKFVEAPFRRKEIFSKRAISIFSLLGSLVFIGIGLAGYFNGGFQQRSFVYGYTDLLVRNYQPDNGILQKQSWSNLKKLSGDSSYSIIGNDYDRQLWYKEGDNRKKILLVGNSHSKDMYNTFLCSEDVRKNFQVARYGAYISDLNEEGSDFFSTPNYKKADILMIVTRYSKSDSIAMDAFVQRLLTDGKIVVIARGVDEFHSGKKITVTDGILQEKIRSGVSINDFSVTSIVGEVEAAYYNKFSSGNRTDVLKISDIAIEKIAAKHKEVILLDRMDYVVDKELKRYFVVNDQFEKFFYDYGHYTLEGAVFFGEQIDKIGWLDKLIKRSFTKLAVIPAEEHVESNLSEPSDKSSFLREESPEGITTKLDGANVRK